MYLITLCTKFLQFSRLPDCDIDFLWFLPVICICDSFFTEKYDSLKVLKDVVSGVMAGSAGNAILLKHHELKSKKAASDRNKVRRRTITAMHTLCTYV